jgi:acyl carrier protein
MMTDAAEAKLRELFRAALELPHDTDVTEARQPSVAGWDSLAHVSLMLAIESEFGILIDAADQIRLTSYSAIRGYLEERGA